MGRKTMWILVLVVGAVFLALEAKAQMHHDMMPGPGVESEQPCHEEGESGEGHGKKHHQGYGMGGMRYPGMTAPGGSGQIYPGMMVYPGMIVFPGIIVYPGMMGYGMPGPGQMPYGRQGHECPHHGGQGHDCPHHGGHDHSRPGEGMRHHGGEGEPDCHGPQAEATGEPLDLDKATQLLERYLEAVGNPNLKAGEAREEEQDFEVEVLTQEGSLVDKILIDKQTGRMRSVY